MEKLLRKVKVGEPVQQPTSDPVLSDHVAIPMPSDDVAIDIAS